MSNTHWQGRMSGRVLPEDLVEDRDLSPSDIDLFSHDVIVSRVAEILQVSKGPLNVGVFGAWGTGKTSFLNRLHEGLVRRQRLWSPTKFRVVRYDAWRYGSAALRRDLIAVASRQLGVRGPQFSSGLFEGRQTVRVEANDVLQRARLFLVGVAKVLVMLGILGAIVFAGWVLLRNVSVLSIPELTFENLRDRLPTAAAWATGIAAAANVPTLLGVSVNRSKPSEDDEFSQTLRDLVSLAEVPYLCRYFVAVPVLGRVIRSVWRRRIVFLIDELDRSSDLDIVATLNALQTLLSTAGVYVVLAADRAVVGSALETHRHQAGPAREFDPYRSGYESYFDKLFQVQFSLPPLRHERVEAFASDLVVRRLGVWAHVRRAGVLDDVIYALIPGHIDSPRRVKVLLNAFASSCRVAQGRGLDAESMFLDIAQWVVFQNEFPTFAEDCLIDPRLKSSMLAGDEPGSPTASRIRQRHDRTDEPPESNQSKDWVDWNRRQLLWQYLEQVSHLGDPPRSLLYLEEAGSAVGHFEPGVATALDNAGDVSPQRTMDLIPAELNQADRLRVASFLARRSRASRSIAKDRLISVLASIVMTIDRDGLEPVGVYAPILRGVDVDRALMPVTWFAAVRTAVLSDDVDRLRQLTKHERIGPEAPDFPELLDHIECNWVPGGPMDVLAEWLVRFVSPAFVERLAATNAPLCASILSRASGHLLIADELSDQATCRIICDVIVQADVRVRDQIVGHIVEAVLETADDVPLLATQLNSDERLTSELRSEIACAVVSEYGAVEVASEFAPSIEHAPMRVDAAAVVSKLWVATLDGSTAEVGAQALNRLFESDSNTREAWIEIVDTEGWHPTDADHNGRRASAIERVTSRISGDALALNSVSAEDPSDLVDLVLSGALRGLDLAAVRRCMTAHSLGQLDSAIRTASRGRAGDDQLRAMEARLELRANLPDKTLNRVPNPEVARVARIAAASKQYERLRPISELHFSTRRTDSDLISYLKIVRNVTGIPLESWSEQHSDQAVAKVWSYLANAGYDPSQLRRLAPRCRYDSNAVRSYLVTTAKGPNWQRSVDLIRTATLARPDVAGTSYALVEALAGNDDVNARKAGVRLASDLDLSKLPDWLRVVLSASPQSYFRRASERALATLLDIGKK